jgi:hypothetical protein
MMKTIQVIIKLNCCLLFFLVKITYSLTSVSFNEPTLNRIQQNAIAQFIRMLGFEKCFPRAAIYGPETFGGLGIQQLYSTSMSKKLETIICHMNTNSSLGVVFN